MLPDEKLQLLQQRATRRNKKTFTLQPKKQAVYLKRRSNQRTDPAAPGFIDFHQVLAGQRLIMSYLVISYRPVPGDGGLFVPGAWKQFRDLSEAQGWLNSRAKRGAAVYTGQAIYTDFGQVLQAWGDPDTHHSVWLAVKHYLGWRHGML